MQVTNKLILGTVQMGLDYGVNNSWGRVLLGESLEILKCAHANGISMLDAAEAYGEAHKIIGIFHQNYPNIKFDIITKVPKVIDGNIISKVDGYLKTLNVETLDTLMFHAFSTFKDNPESLEKMIQLKEKGIVKKIGVSIYTNEEFIEAIENTCFDVIQIPFNLFDNWSLRGVLIEEAKAKGKIIHTRSAFLQGLFFKDSQDKHKVVQALRYELSLINDIAHREQKSIASLALNYCLQNELIDNVLIGVDSVLQLKSNIAVAGKKISFSSMNAINNINIKDITLLNPSTWN